MMIQNPHLLSLAAWFSLFVIPTQYSLADQKDKSLLPLWGHKVISLDGTEQDNARKLQNLVAEGWQLVARIEKGKVKLRRHFIKSRVHVLTAQRIKAIIENPKKNSTGKIEGSDSNLLRLRY